MQLIGKSSSNDISNLGMLPSMSNDIAVKFPYQCIHIQNDTDRFNGIKIGRKMQNR